MWRKNKNGKGHKACYGTSSISGERCHFSKDIVEDRESSAWVSEEWGMVGSLNSKYIVGLDGGGFLVYLGNIRR